MFRMSCAIVLTAVVATAASNPATFNKDVLPILQKNCQTCHRPGEIAPMSLLTYKDARPWSKALKAAVLSGKMPPWLADPGYGHFANEQRLSQSQIATLVSWVDNGAVEGDAKDAPAPVTFNDGWNIKPDLVVEMPTAFQVPATGTIDYQYMLVKVNFPEDRWVVAAEMRPGNSKVVHHGEVWVRPLGSTWMADATPGVAYGTAEMSKSASEGNDILAKYNPGLGAQSFALGDSAKFIPKGSDLVFEIHYTAVGTAASDKTRVGIVFAKHPPKTRYVTSYGPGNHDFVISPGDGNAEVVSEITAQADVTLAYVQPHMHLRGKDYEVRVIYASGESETVFKGKFDFHWQLGYELAKPLALRKGDRIVAVAHFDNSANNPFNPDPQKEVRWGPQNWDEMQNCFLGLLIDAKADPSTVLRSSGPSLTELKPGRGDSTLATPATKTAN